MANQRFDMANANEYILILTRYLYSYTEVRQALLLALLDRNCAEALFWAYEIYESGFAEDGMEFLKKIYTTFYETQNPMFLEKFSKLEPDLWFGSVVATLCGRPYDISPFMTVYAGVKCVRIESPTPKAFTIFLKPKDVEKYKTLEIDSNESRPNYLERACRFQLRKEMNRMFDTTPEIQLADYDHWLYYAARSPLWSTRIQEHGGNIDPDTKTVRFDTEDDEEEFYDRWGLHPDEQSIELHQKWLGKPGEQQLSYIDFCKRYGAKMAIKKRIPAT
jgi:hypothetical protein